MLTFRELEPLTSLRTTRLLTLDGTCVAREEAEIAKFATMRFVDIDEGGGDGETQRAGLARVPAAINVGLHVVTTECVGRDKRLLNRRHVRRTRERVDERAPVDVPLAGARLDEDAADGFLAASDRVNCLHVGHDYFSLLSKVNVVGCCATCGCSAVAYTRSLRRNT